ncbi:uncharacterized protein [Petaurus breviceps papuanus]|uniref:uncharacterized protein n=1 Tax=Petaurus breviceps papuanus TaxID=3040969 RepID=UPI0036DB7D31
MCAWRRRASGPGAGARHRLRQSVSPCHGPTSPPPPRAARRAWPLTLSSGACGSRGGGGGSSARLPLLYPLLLLLRSSPAALRLSLLRLPLPPSFPPCQPGIDAPRPADSAASRLAPKPAAPTGSGRGRQEASRPGQDRARAELGGGPGDRWCSQNASASLGPPDCSELGSWAVRKVARHLPGSRRSLIHSDNNHLLSACDAPGVVLSYWDTKGWPLLLPSRSSQSNGGDKRTHSSVPTRATQDGLETLRRSTGL